MRLINWVKELTSLEVTSAVLVLAFASLFVMPRFFNTYVHSRREVIEALAASIRANAALAHSIAAIHQNGSVIDYSGISVDMFNEYPAATSNGISKTIKLITGFMVSYNQHQAHFFPGGVQDPLNCSVIYTQPIIPGRPPTILVNISDCT